MLLRRAMPAEAPALSALALRSKGHWGYDAAFLAACREELTYTTAQLRDPAFRFVVADCDGRVTGFYALEARRGEFELEALFVEPAHIGTGVGRALLGHAVDTVAAAGGASLLIQGDPHAETFYRAAGARRVGSRPSASIPGRELPLFAITITTTIGR